MLKSLYSYLLALCIALLVIAPPLDYSIPLMVNSFFWCYLVILSGFLGMLLLYQDLQVSLKILTAYLFASCFLSQSPYMSFNAYILVVVTLYFFLAFQKADYRIILQVVQAAFWFEVVLTIFQLLGRDRLINFDRPESVFLGTVMQYMRFSSMLAIMAPLLIARSRLYLIPLTVFCILSRSSTFAVSLVAGVVSYFLISPQKKWTKAGIILAGILCVGAYALYDLDSFRGAILPANGGRLVSWWAILKTWVMDTAAAKPPAALAGPWRWDWFFFGHGMDTFLPLFPIYKHDINPFPQAHNDWLQFPWEIGILGFAFFAGYCFFLMVRLQKMKRHDLMAGLVCIGTNMFFAFPSRMTQTVLLMVAYTAYCEAEMKKGRFA